MFLTYKLHYMLLIKEEKKIFSSAKKKYYTYCCGFASMKNKILVFYIFTNVVLFEILMFRFIDKNGKY